MQSRRKHMAWLAGIAVVGLAPLAAFAQEKKAAKQFIYVLRLSARLHQQDAWTDADRKSVSEHFQYLKRATDESKVILAGRTDDALDKTFGLVIFEAENESAASEFMNGDPAVKAGTMQATLHPYSIALARKTGK